MYKINLKYPWKMFTRLIFFHLKLAMKNVLNWNMFRRNTENLETKRLERNKGQHQRQLVSLKKFREAIAELESAQEDAVARIKKLQEKVSSAEKELAAVEREIEEIVNCFREEAKEGVALRRQLEQLKINAT